MSNTSSTREVWITGIGLASSLGEGLDQHWDAVTRFKQTLADISRAVIEDGIAEGRFRAPANMDEAVIAVGSTLMLCAHPVLLQEGLREDNPGRARALADLVVRSLMRP